MYLLSPVQDTASAPFFTSALLSQTPGFLTFEHISHGAEGDSKLQRWSSLIGIVTAIVGNILISFALNIQRYAHIRLHRADLERREKSRESSEVSPTEYGTTHSNGSNRGGGYGRDGWDEESPLRPTYNSSDSHSTAYSDSDGGHESSYLQSPYWWSGIVLMTVGEAGNFLAYGFAPASIVSPLGVVALISNCVIAPIMLKERFRMRDFWGVVVAVGGAVTVVLSAKQQETKLGPHAIWGAITTLEFEVYMAVTIGLIVILLWASPRYGNRTILVDLGLVGLFGGYTALSTKGVASMLSYTLWRALTTPVTYALLTVLIGTAVLQVKYVNRALQRFDSTQVIPVQFVMFTLSVIIGSAVLYRDFEKAKADNVIKFIGGCLLTFFGVFLITSGRATGDNDEESAKSDSGEEASVILTAQERGEENAASDGIPRYPSGYMRLNTGPMLGGDSAFDDDSLKSRRNSKVGFIDSRPRTPGLYSSSSQPPSIRVVPADLPASFSNETENSSLLNFGGNASEELLQAARHPGIHSTISSPLLPSEAQTSSEFLRPSTGRSITQANFHTHSTQQQGNTSPQVERPVISARHSISRIMPGPLLSPLSGGLSAIVADSLRRGVESPLRSKSFRRMRLGVSQTKQGGYKLGSSADVDEDEIGTSPLKYTETPGEARLLGSEELDRSLPQITRARSLSTTLRDMFGENRRKYQNSQTMADDEAGPSGS